MNTCDRPEKDDTPSNRIETVFFSYLEFRSINTIHTNWCLSVNEKNEMNSTYRINVMTLDLFIHFSVLFGFCCCFILFYWYRNICLIFHTYTKKENDRQKTSLWSAVVNRILVDINVEMDMPKQENIQWLSAQWWQIKRENRSFVSPSYVYA